MAYGEGHVTEWAEHSAIFRVLRSAFEPLDKRKKLFRTTIASLTKRQHLHDMA